MIRKYYKFNVPLFFGDYREQKRRKRQLENEYRDAVGGSGTDYTRPKVTGGMPSDMVASASERREKIAKQIAKVDEYFSLYDAIMNGLCDADVRFVESYYMGNGRTSAKNRTKANLGLSNATFYRELKRINDLISEIADRETMYRA